MARTATFTKEQGKERQNAAKAAYLKARTKLNLVYENEDAITYREFAKDEGKSLTEIFKVAIDEKIEHKAQERNETIEEYKAYLDKQYRKDVDKAGEKRGAITTEERLAKMKKK